MTPEPAPDREERLTRLLAEYVAAVEAGEAADPRAWADRHPEFRDELVEFATLRGRLEHLTARPDRCPAGPRELGGYELVGELGRGGMGVVYRARQPGSGREVALKVILSGRFATDAERQRFRTETEAAARLDHPGIVPVYHVGEADGHLFYTMKLLEGGDLRAHLPRLRTAPRAAARLVAALARAVHHAHQRGVLHRDLKPSNILLDRDGQPYVADFGLAWFDGHDQLTHPGELVGTLDYMAPELAAGDRGRSSTAADVYGVGGVLYACLTGRPPGARAPQQSGDLAPPRRLNPVVPRDLEAVCLKCLERAPEQRYPSAAAVAEDLDRFSSGRPTRARPVGPVTAAARWTRRRPAVAALLALAVVAWGAIPAIVVSYSDRLATEAANRRAAEVEAAASDAEAGAAERRAREHEFYAELERVRQRRADPSPGWADETLADVRELAAQPTAAEVLHDLRSEAAAALAAVDLRPVRVVAPGFMAYAPAYSPDGSTLALCGWRADPLTQRVRVRLFDPTTGAPRRELTAVVAPPGVGDREGCRAVCFSPDGRWLIAGTRNGRLVRWDLTAPKDEGDKESEGTAWAGHSGDAPVPGRAPGRNSIVALAFSADGGTLYSSSKDTTRAWDVGGGWAAIGEPRDVVVPLGTSVLPAAFPVMATPTDFGRKLSRAAPRGEGPPTGVVGSELFTVTRDGRLAGLLNRDNKPHLAATDADGVPRPLLGWDDAPLEVTALGFSPDAGLLVTAEEHEKRIKVWDVAGRQLAIDRPLDGGSGRFAFSPDGRHLAVTEHERAVIYAVTGGARETLAVGPRAWADVVAARPDGHGLAVLCADPFGPIELSTWDVAPDHPPVETGRRALGYWGSRTPSTAFAPDGSRYAFTTSRTNSERNEPGDRIVCGDKAIGAESVSDLRFGPDGRLWAADAHRVRVWTLPGWTEAVPLTNDPVTRAAGMVFRAVAPGRRLSAVGRRDGRVFLLPAGQPARPPVAALGSAVTAVALTADEGRVLVGGEGGELAVVGADGTVGPVLKAHRDRVTSVVVGPGGWIATASADRTVKLWEAPSANPSGFADLRPILTLRFDGGVRRVAVSDDGRLLTVAVAGERGVRRWRLDRLAAALAELGLSPGWAISGTR